VPSPARRGPGGPRTVGDPRGEHVPKVAPLISQPKLTTGNLLKRWQAYADAYGPINGRKVVVKSAVWDPIDPTTFDEACASATQDHKPLVVVNGNGYRSASIPCITVDNRTPMIVGGANFKTYVIDGASSMCTIFAAGRIPGEAAGIPCLTAADTRALPTKDGIKKDSPAEAQCRADFDKAFAATSQPGVPSGDVTAGGVTYSEDFAANECQIMRLLLPAIKKAGKNPTWAKIAANLQKTSGPAIYMSGGEGSYSKTKPYYADNLHLVVLNQANAQTPKDANGTFNGCPAPVNCWVPQLVNGQEWFPINQ
jgi:hypothetical protein